MPKDYRLCPKCNNALDNNIMQCPYCGENTIFSSTWGKENNITKTEPTIQEKKSSWCGCGWCLTFIIFLAIITFIILTEIKFKEISDPHNSPFFQVNHSND